MIQYTPEQIARSAVERYRGDAVDFPRFVAELEQAVTQAEAMGLSEARDLRRIWGQLEIINALALDEQRRVSKSDPKVEELIDLFLGGLPGESKTQM